MDIAAILTRRFAGQEWKLNGDSYSGLTWLSDTEIPSESELEKLWPVVKAELDSEKQAKEDARLSAIKKLNDLGLTVEEVQIAFGLSNNV